MLALSLKSPNLPGFLLYTTHMLADCPPPFFHQQHFSVFSICSGIKHGNVEGSWYSHSSCGRVILVFKGDLREILLIPSRSFQVKGQKWLSEIMIKSVGKSSILDFPGTFVNKPVLVLPVETYTGSTFLSFFVIFTTSKGKDV